MPNLAELPPIESDDWLMGQVSQGDLRAFQELVDRYWPRLVSYAETIARSPDVADDITQAVFVRVWERRSRWAPNGTVGAFLFRMTRNAALNARRDARLRERRECEAASHGLRTVTYPRPVDDLHIRAEVERALAALPERRREVFVLSRFHGLSHAEIAAVLEIAVQSVANHMTIALGEMRASLSQLLGE